MGNDLEELFEKPHAMINNAIAALGKKTAATLFGSLKIALSTAGDPLLRKNMGERYLSGGHYVGGSAIWVGSTLLALASPSLRSAAAIVCNMTNSYRAASFFASGWFTLLVGGALVLLHNKYCVENLRLMARYRAEGTAYHTQSRGIPRWGGDSILVGMGITAALFLFDLPAGVLFVISCSMSAKLAAEQQAAIHSRYLDALDAKIEQEYLEEAILGQCPTEITQLCKPLPTNMNSDLRKNIAAAAMGKPVKIIAKAPRTGGNGQSGPGPSEPREPVSSASAS
jgi:hypothetical protein